jgi:Creatinine amidohydrolase
MALPKPDWMEMTWQEIAGAGNDTARWIAVLPLAAVEQHGPHLPLGVDTFIAEAYLARVREILPADLPVTFLPVQRIGVSVEHVAFPGTLTLSASAAITAWTEIGESLVRAGLRKLVLITSHGGNVAAMELVARDLRARHGMLAVTVGWHRFGYPESTFSSEEKRHGIHVADARRQARNRASRTRPQCHAGNDRDGGRVQVARRLSAGRLRLDDPGYQPDRRRRRRHARHGRQGRGGACAWRESFCRIIARD